MIDILSRSLYVVILSWILVSCGSEDKTPTPAPNPIAKPVQTPPAAEEPPLVDPYGRLAEGKDRHYGFPIPALAMAEPSVDGLTQVYRVQALERAVLEFYLHRKYHVIKTGRSHSVRHSSITLDRSGNAENEHATLFITRRALRDQRFRIVYTAPVKRHIPAVNAEVLEERTDLKEPQRKALETHLPKKKKTTTNAALRPVPPFNPTIPRNVGTQAIKPQVKKWLKKNPGEVFYD